MKHTDTGVDNGSDLRVGDIVFIKFIVLELPTAIGDVKLQYLPRNGKDEYAGSTIASVFVKRPSAVWVKNLLNLVQWKSVRMRFPTERSFESPLDSK